MMQGAAMVAEGKYSKSVHERDNNTVHCEDAAGRGTALGKCVEVLHDSLPLFAVPSPKKLTAT